MNILNWILSFKLRWKEKISNRITIITFLRAIYFLIKNPLECIKNSFMKAMVGLTYRCQLSCQHCGISYYPKIKNKELNILEIEKIIDKIKNLPSLLSLISFFGGEPLLRSDLLHLINYSTQKGLITELETNGLLLSKHNVLKLKKNGLRHIFVSVDSSKKEKHDELRGKAGSYQKAINGITNCIKCGLSCSISTYATSNNIKNGDLNDIITLGKKLGVSSVRILLPVFSGKMRENRGLNKKEMQKLKNILEPGFAYLETTSCSSKNSSHFCAARKKKFFYISPYGEVQPCPFVPISFGKVNKKPLKDILNKMWASYLLNKNHFRCITYDYKKVGSK